VVGLSQVGFVLLLEAGFHPLTAALGVLLIAPLLGLIHGLLITRLQLQPFLVTLCGLFVYRGLAQWFTSFKDGEPRSVGIAATGVDVRALRFWVTGNIEGVSTILLPLLLVAGVAAVILHLSVHGRYLFAIGANEQAARYAGINTDRYKILAYMWCSLLAGLGGILYMLEVGTADGLTAGQWLELYAITGAVLGGCSLRGGEGTVPGVLLGMTFLPLLRNLCTFANIPDKLQFPVFGLALLIGTIVDEILKRRAVRSG
jgi:ribose transport system permease protein